MTPSQFPLQQPRKAIRLELKTPAGPLQIAGLPTLAETARIIQQWEISDRQLAQALLAGTLPGKALAALGVRLCLRAGHTQAVEVLAAAVVLLPDDLSILNNLAVALERADRTADAITAVEHSLGRSGQQIDSWIFLGTLKRKTGDLPAAAAALETAVSIDPTAALAWQALGLIHQQQGHHRQAIEHLLNCIRLNHVSAALLSVLGQLFYTTGQFDKSRNAYAAAVESDRTNFLYQQLHQQMQFICAMMNGQDIDTALDQYLSAAGYSPSSTDAEELLHKSTALLSAYGHREPAIRVATRRVALFPTSPTAAYLLHAMREDPTIARSPDDYLVESFNQAAERFDQHLVEKLGYDIPQKLTAALAIHLPSHAKLDVLDAGCGTGLCGPHLRPFAASLTDVDLANKMLDRARDRRMYDALFCEEITTFLNRSPAAFDAIIAADVIIYFGDLTPLAAALAPRPPPQRPARLQHRTRRLARPSPANLRPLRPLGRLCPIRVQQQFHRTDIARNPGPHGSPAAGAG